MDESCFDPERLRYKGAPAKPKPHRIPRSENPFVKVPEIWLDALASMPDASVVTYRVAIYLIKYGWKSPKRTVKLTNTTIGVDRHAKYKAIRAMRKAGLIAVEERGRKSPIVTVRHLV